jgi:hypothetical protein
MAQHSFYIRFVTIFQFCWVPLDDAIVVSAGKLRKLCDSLSEQRSSMCERQHERTVLKSALLPVKTGQFAQFFRQVWRHTVKSLSSTESVYAVLHKDFQKVLLLSELRPKILYAVSSTPKPTTTLNAYQIRLL